MSKISLEIINEVMQEEGIEPTKQAKIIEHLKEIIEEEKKDREENKLPKIRPELGVILLDELRELKKDNISALIYEIPANSNHNDVFPNIKKAVIEFNNTKKGQKSPIKSIQEAFQIVKPKIFKNNGNLKRKTKEIVRCLVSNGKI